MDVFSMLHIPILYNCVFLVWIQIDLVAYKNALGLGNKNVNIDGYDIVFINTPAVVSI